MRLDSISVQKAGRINWMVIVAIIAVGALAFVFTLGGNTPQRVANQFMVALAKGDVDTLVELSEGSGQSSDELRRQWDFAVNRAAPYYRFHWQILNTKEADAQTAAVNMWVWRNATTPGVYEERYALPMAKVDGEWRVLVRELNREMYPALPR